jgi:hypothetical protein
MLTEYTQDYLCHLLSFFADAKALGPLLAASSIVAHESFDRLADRIDGYLNTMGYSPLNRQLWIP